MKYLIAIFLLLFSLTSSARKVYVKAAGNNSSNGLTDATAWQTLAKVTSSAIFGDTVYLRRGEVFYGSVVSGANNITYLAYGAGSKPLITGFTTLSSWTNMGGNIWKASLNGILDLKTVTFNGVLQQIGRYPNANTADGGYLTYEGGVPGSTLIDNQLPGSPNWAGANIVIKKHIFRIEEDSIVSQSGTTFTYAPLRAISPVTNPVDADAVPNQDNGFGYFIQNDLRTLDIQGEWYYKKSTNEFYIYSTTDPGLSTIKVSTIPTLISVGARTNILVRGIRFEGANKAAISAQNGNTLTVDSCDFNTNGQRDVQTWNVNNTVVSNGEFTNTLSTPLELRNNYTTTDGTGITVSHCNFTNSGMMPGMGSNYGNDYYGISTTCYTNTLIEYCTITTTGFNAIAFNGNNILIKNTYINGFCYIMDDGAAFYTFVDVDGSNWETPVTRFYFVNRVIQDCVAENGIGNSDGTTGSGVDVQGGYTDGISPNVAFLRCTFKNIRGPAIYHNNPRGMVDRGNIIINCERGIGITAYSYGGAKENIITSNIFILENKDDLSFHYHSVSGTLAQLPANLQLIGLIDSNFYNLYNPLSFGIQLDADYGTPLNFETWKTTGLHDQHGIVLTQTPKYIVSSSYGVNQATSSGTFNSNITGYTAVGGGSSGVWDGNGQISGAGSYRFNQTSVRLNLTSYIHSPVGDITKDSLYVFRFKTRGTITAGSVKTYLRLTTVPNTTYSNIEVNDFGTGIEQHEILFKATATAKVSIVLEILNAAKITYIDDIEFKKATGYFTTIKDTILVITNLTPTTNDYPLDAYYIDPFSSIQSSRSIPPMGTSVNWRVGSLAVTGNEKIRLLYKLRQ